MFAFLSIGVQLNQQSDKSRFTVLGLMAFDKKKDEKSFVKFTDEWHKLVTPDYVKSLQSRTMKMIPIILNNAKMFSDAVSQVIGNKRIGDQVGVMLAGAYSLTSDHEISFENALKWVAEKDWAEEKALELTKDEYRLFGKLMGSVVKIDGEFRTLERSIGEVILIAKGERFETQVNPTTATELLLRIGMKIKSNRLYISNTTDGVSKLLKDSPWSSNYHKVLERLEDARKENSTSFAPGIRTRAVSINLDMIKTDIVLVSNPNYLNEQYKKDEQQDLPF
jgi:putative DNA primase/helicase